MQFEMSGRREAVEEEKEEERGGAWLGVRLFSLSDAQSK